MKLTYKELTTVTSEVEAVLNSWPLTCIYENEVEEVLTPSHLYCGRRLLDEQNSESSDEDITEISNAENLAKRRRHMNKIIERFWRKWQKEYLINLRESHKMKTSKKSLKINVGDAVSVFDEGLKRRHWKVGKVLKILRGKDDVIRGAIVQIFNDKNGKETVSRPLQKLYPLEITLERDDDETPIDTNDIEIEESKSLIDLDSTGGDLGGSYAGVRTKIRQAAVADGDIKGRLLQQDEEDEKFDDFRCE